jgi:hypothetical protein
VRGTYFLAFVTGHAVEYPGQFERSSHLFLIVARIERGLAQLNEWRGTGKIGEIAKPDHRARRVAAHAADAIERARSILHLSVGERLWKPCVRFAPLDPRLKLREFFLVAAAVDDEIPNDSNVAQRLDEHLRFDRFPARQHFAAVHPHRAGAAHLRSAEPAKGEIGSRIVRDPVQGIQYPHPFLVRHFELLVRVIARLRFRPAQLDPHEIAGRKARIAGGQRVVLFELPHPAGVDGGRNRRGSRAGGSVGGRDRHHQATSRLSFLAKPGAKNGSS